MSETVTAAAPHEKSLMRRIVEFPLVAMVIAVLLYAVANLVGLLIGKPLPLPEGDTRSIVQSAINVVLVFAVYKLAMRRLGVKPRDDLPLDGAVKGVATGLVFGFILFSLLVVTAALLGVYRIVGPGGTQELLRDAVLISILPGFLEELFFRGILFRWIEEFAGTQVALASTSLLFGFAHYFNPNATVFSSLAIAIEAGLLLGGAYVLTRNLWMVMGLHAAWNFTQGFIFDVPVSGLDQHGMVEAKLSGPELLSGGAFGLEASLIAFVIASAAGIWLLVLAGRKGNLVPFWPSRQELARSHAELSAAEAG
ncbi:MAG: type II CAAX endopeptidase family protein [Sphingomicrobium sp.]